MSGNADAVSITGAQGCGTCIADEAMRCRMVVKCSSTASTCKPSAKSPALPSSQVLLLGDEDQTEAHLAKRGARMAQAWLDSGMQGLGPTVVSLPIVFRLWVGRHGQQAGVPLMQSVHAPRYMHSQDPSADDDGTDTALPGALLGPAASAPYANGQDRGPAGGAAGVPCPAGHHVCLPSCTVDLYLNCFCLRASTAAGDLAGQEGDGSLAGTASVARGPSSDYSRGKRLRKLLRLLSSRAAVETLNTFKLHIHLLVAGVVLLHAACFVIMLYFINHQATYVTDITAAGRLLWQHHELLLHGMLLADFMQYNQGLLPQPVMQVL